MLSAKTSYFLLLIVLLLGPSHAKDFSLVITPQIIEDPQPKTPFNSSSLNYKPINITFDHSNVNITDTFRAESQHLNESVLPQVQNYIGAALKVLPRSSKIIIAKPDICKDIVKIPAYASETGFDSDLVVFVKITQSTDKELVRGAPCGLDETTGRPIVGVLTFNRMRFMNIRYMNAIEIERLIGQTLRELVHILGFQESLFPYYINPDTLKPLTGHFFNKTVNDVNTLVLNVAPLTQRVRDYFNCPTAEGAYLENQGDSSTINSHFERRIFGNELMTAGEVFDRRMSQFTLALLEGTGWYKVNYDLAEPMTYGKNQGCDFLDTKCIDSGTLKPNFKEFCSPLTSKGVSWTKRGSGFCGTIVPEDISYNADSNLPAAFDYWGNQTVVDDKYSDNCPYYYTPYSSVELSMTLEFDCENINYLKSARLPDYESRGPGSKAFMGTLAQKGNSGAYGGYCFTPKCVSKPNGHYEVEVSFGSAGIVNCYAAGTFHASDFGFKNDMEGALECPDPYEFCEQILSEGYCKGGCFGRGVCSERQCKCQDGWGSDACVAKQEVQQSSRCTQDRNRTTAYGDDCICSEKNITCQCALGLKTGYDCIKREYNNSTNDDDNNNQNHNNNNNNNSSSENPQPADSRNNRAKFLFGGLVLVAITVFFIKRRKQADELNISLIQESRSHEVSAL